MKIAIIGMGYVGLVTAACLAEVGNHVTCIDKDPQKVAMLNSGRVPFFEPGLETLVNKARTAGNLEFHASLPHGVSGADIVFLAIGTPTAADGRVYLESVMACAKDLAGLLCSDTLVVVKSTVPVGTCERIQTILNAKRGNGLPSQIVVASNPEFLAEGRAIDDFRCPERIVVGCPDENSRRVLERLYKPFDPEGDRYLAMDVRSAEFAKYACNAMLAARISMVNELAGIAGHVNADMRAVCRVMKSDPRIGPYYLEPGVGYGGSCLPKDLRALISMARDNDEPASMLRSVEEVNVRQGELLFDAISTALSHDLENRCVALWGLSFKPGTDDMREAPSLTLITALNRAGVRVQAFDPVAGHAALDLAKNAMFDLCTDAYSACEEADVLVVITEWDDFKHPDFRLLARKLSTAMVFDCRNLYETSTLCRYGLIHIAPGQQVPRAAQPSRPALQKAV